MVKTILLSNAMALLLTLFLLVDDIREKKFSPPKQTGRYLFFGMVILCEIGTLIFTLLR